MHLTTHGEANEVGADTEASTLTSRNTNAGRDNIKDSKDGGSNYTESDDVLEGKRLGGDKDSSDGYKETLNEVLDKTINDFGCGVHTSIFLPKIFLERGVQEKGLNTFYISSQNA